MWLAEQQSGAELCGAVMSVEAVVPAGMEPAAEEQAQERHVFFLRKVRLSDCGWW